ncbi:hypothetical protein [Amycolatopsis sp. H20-H5]|uniref:hypothetical protein n=1 Tax=Amycolatopsis sp. H20-H5 TaxID=3046309 RepID=UPI002DB7E734|nr:hypothetical protein [Amycolatopsis sp. H20-H5]MEC3979610.1 hypothetical protein [Amycolatopsis sp. H20-H5]
MATLREIRDRIFAAGDYLWEEDEPRPGSVEELFENPDVQEEGTHSALDVYRFIGQSDQDDFGTVKHLTADELTAAFGTQKPSPADYERLVAANGLPYDKPRWSAGCAFLYQDGKAVELAIWGHTGD